MKLDEFIEYQKKQIENIVTKESLGATEIKKYYSGREIKVGDVVLIGIIQENDDVTGLPIKIINFHEDEIDTIYEIDENYSKQKIGFDLPIIKMKKK